MPQRVRGYIAPDVLPSQSLDPHAHCLSPERTGVMLEKPALAFTGFADTVNEISLYVSCFHNLESVNISLA